MAACARDGVGVTVSISRGVVVPRVSELSRYVLRWLWWRCAEDVLEHQTPRMPQWLRIDPVGRGSKDGRLTKGLAVATPAFDFETLVHYACSQWKASFPWPAEE